LNNPRNDGAISLWASLLPYLIAQSSIVHSSFGRLPALFRIQLPVFAYVLVEKPFRPVVARGLSSFYRSWNPRLHYRRRCLRLADARMFIFGRALRRWLRFAGLRFTFPRGLRVEDRLGLPVTDRLGLRIADRLGQHLEQLGLRLPIAHRSPP
jgi:hypothetical protein